MRKKFKISVNHKGFTMIELVLVLIVLAILAPIVASRFTTGHVEVAAQGDVLRSHIRFAQIMAMNDTVRWGINFKSSTTYELFKDGVTTPPAILPGNTSHVHNLTDNVTIASGVGTSISFDEWGRPTDIFGALLTTNLTITLSPSAGASSTITVTKNTGFIP